MIDKNQAARKLSPFTCSIECRLTFQGLRTGSITSFPGSAFLIQPVLVPGSTCIRPVGSKAAAGGRSRRPICYEMQGSACRQSLLSSVLLGTANLDRAKPTAALPRCPVPRSRVACPASPTTTREPSFPGSLGRVAGHFLTLRGGAAASHLSVHPPPLGFARCHESGGAELFRISSEVAGAALRAALSGANEVSAGGNLFVIRCRLPRDRPNPGSEACPVAARRRHPSIVLHFMSPQTPFRRKRAREPSATLFMSTPRGPRTQAVFDKPRARSHVCSPPTEVAS